MLDNHSTKHIRFMTEKEMVEMHNAVHIEQSRRKTPGKQISNFISRSCIPCHIYHSSTTYLQKWLAYKNFI